MLQVVYGRKGLVDTEMGPIKWSVLSGRNEYLQLQKRGLTAHMVGYALQSKALRIRVRS